MMKLSHLLYKCYLGSDFPKKEIKKAGQVVCEGV